MKGSLATNATLEDVRAARPDIDAILLRAINADLLAALEALLNEVEAAGNATADDYGWPTVVPQARAAIAKARNQ